MPGVSTDGIYQQVRRMTIPIANWTGAAVSGNLPYPQLNTTHGLTDGRIPTLPSWVAEQMDAFRAYVVFDKGSVYGDVESYVSFPSYSAAGTDRVQVIVAASLADECFARAQNGEIPLYLDIRVLFKSPHSVEGRGTDQGEGFPANPLGSLFAVPRGGSTSGLETVWVDPVNGLDTNNGHTLATAWQTMGRVKTYMEFVQCFYHSLAVRCVAGPVGDWTAARSNFCPENITFVGDSRLYIMGSPPEPDAVVPILNGDKQLTIAGPATVHTPRDCDHLRMTPAAGEIWQDTAAAGNVALTAADIGKTVHITDGAGGHVAYATVSGVSGQDADVANRWVEVCVNSALCGIPNWIGDAGTVWTILDPTDPQGTAASANAQVVAMAGTWNLMGIRSTAGSVLQTNGIPSKFHCISHIRFTANQVTLEDCDRFALPGCRFEAGIAWHNCRDCSAISNAVSDAGADRYFPDAIWVLQGFTLATVGTAAAFGGMGFYTDITAAQAIASGSRTRVIHSTGAIAGLCATGPAAPNRGSVYVTGGNVLFSFASVGPDAADLASIWCEGIGSMAGVMNGRLTCQLHSATGGTIYVSNYNSWLERAVKLADDAPDPTVAATKLNPGAVAPSPGLIHAETGGAIEIILSAATVLEGINSDDDGGYVVHVGEGCKFIATGGQDVNLYGDHGWLHMAGSSTGYMSGPRAFPNKLNAVMAADVYVNNSVLTSGPVDVWTKAGVQGVTEDTVPSPVIWVDHHGKFKLGSPTSNTGLATNGGLVCGATGAGNGADCGAAGIVFVDNGSHCTIADFQINNDDGGASNPAIVIQNGSFLHHCGENVASYLERAGVAGNAITDGSITFNGGYIPTAEAAARQIHSDYLAALGTAQGTFYRHE